MLSSVYKQNKKAHAPNKISWPTDDGGGGDGDRGSGGGGTLPMGRASNGRRVEREREAAKKKCARAPHDSTHRLALERLGGPIGRRRRRLPPFCTWRHVSKESRRENARALTNSWLAAIATATAAAATTRNERRRRRRRRRRAAGDGGRIFLCACRLKARHEALTLARARMRLLTHMQTDE